MPAGLYSLFRSHRPEDPGAVFLETPEGARLTYGALEDGASGLAAALASFGVVAGDRVAVQVDKSPQAVVLYLACLRLGAIYLPLNTAYTQREVAYFLEDAAPRVFVCAPGREAEFARSREAEGRPDGPLVVTFATDGLGTLAEAIPDASTTGEVPVHEPACDDVAAIVYTSGTTGRSKGAMLTHANLASNALALFDLWQIQRGEVLLHALPIYHAHGLFVALHLALLGGMKVVFLPSFDAKLVTRLLPGCAVYMGVPTHYTRLLAEPGFQRETCRGVRLFVSGSAPLPAEVHEEFESRTGHRVLERYGMSEALMIASNPYDGARVAGTVGFPLPGVKVRVVDDAGQRLGAREVGSLEIAGPNVFPGYWKNEAKTRAAFCDDGFFVTGDLGCLDEEGRVTLVGRSSDLIITGGLNVYPKEVEAVLDSLEGVRESAVIGLPHADFGEAVTAIVVRANEPDARRPDPGAREAEDTPEEARLLAQTRTLLAGFKRPKRMIFVEEIPRNAMGKVEKNALRERFAELYR